MFRNIAGLAFRQRYREALNQEYINVMEVPLFLPLFSITPTVFNKYFLVSIASELFSVSFISLRHSLQ